MGSVLLRATRCLSVRMRDKPYWQLARFTQATLTLGVRQSRLVPSTNKL
jgi:hypothetical protein